MPHRCVAAVSLAGSLLAKAGTAVSGFTATIWLGPGRRYHPEDHYMRGPGPKWREKFDSCRTEPGVVAPVANINGQTSG